jgi:hypothetical protein
MNCKPGDLAVVVSTLGYPILNRCLGAVVKVVRVSEVRRPFGPMWDVEHHDMERVADACLRPIRDPGEDAKDETLQWKEVPTKQKEPA